MCNAPIARMITCQICAEDSEISVALRYGCTCKSWLSDIKVTKSKQPLQVRISLRIVPYARRSRSARFGAVHEPRRRCLASSSVISYERDLWRRRYHVLRRLFSCSCAFDEVWPGIQRLLMVASYKPTR
jgi:hypothetical protein